MTENLSAEALGAIVEVYRLNEELSDVWVDRRFERSVGSWTLAEVAPRKVESCELASRHGEWGDSQG